MTIAKNTITIFNTYAKEAERDPMDFRPPGPAETVYSRTVFKNCQWEDTVDRQANTNGLTQVNNLISIIIPKTKGMKPYKKDFEYNKLPVDLKANYWTLVTSGEIFLGEVPEITPLYTIENARADFRKYIIKGIEDLSDQPVLPHWEITGV